MKTNQGKEYGEAIVVRNGNLRLPNLLVRDFGIRVGDTVTIQQRKTGGWTFRIYRQTQAGWMRLDRGRHLRPVSRPR